MLFIKNLRFLVRWLCELKTVPREEKYAEIITIVFSVSGAIIFTIVISTPEYVLWNWLMPGIFGAPTIHYWQMVGITFVIGMIVRIFIRKIWLRKLTPKHMK